MKKLRRLFAAGLTVALTAGCAGPYEEPGSTGYILGTIFVIIGLALGVALILSLND